MKTDNSGTWARNRSEQLRAEQAKRAEKVRDLHAQLRLLDERETTLLQQLMRANAYKPTSGICPNCFIEEGKSVELSPISIASIMHDGLPEDVDLMRCPDCGWDNTISS